MYSVFHKQFHADTCNYHEFNNASKRVTCDFIVPGPEMGPRRPWA